jgi:hypothetical protein
MPKEEQGVRDRIYNRTHFPINTDVFSFVNLLLIMSYVGISMSHTFGLVRRRLQHRILVELEFFTVFSCIYMLYLYFILGKNLFLNYSTVAIFELLTCELYFVHIYRSAYDKFLYQISHA